MLHVSTPMHQKRNSHSYEGWVRMKDATGLHALKPWKRRFITLDGVTIHIYKQLLKEAEVKGEVQMAKAEKGHDNVFKVIMTCEKKKKSSSSTATSGGSSEVSTEQYFVEPEIASDYRRLLLSVSTAVAAAHSKFMQRGATVKEIVRAQTLMNQLKADFDFCEPDRGNLQNPEISWKSGKPDYTVTNLAYMLGKTKNHSKGSLEITVENLIKTWEMEATHVPFKQWKTVNHDKYRVKTNDSDWVPGSQAAEMGNYNWLLSTCAKDLYSTKDHDFESSHKTFLGAFPNGFPFEVLEVFSGPPKVSFTWRHWATFSGKYEGNQGRGEVVELTGFGMVTLEDMKICDLEIYYNPNPFLEVLHGSREAEDLRENGAARGDPIVLASGCPFGP